MKQDWKDWKDCLWLYMMLKQNCPEQFEWKYSDDYQPSCINLKVLYIDSEWKQQFCKDFSLELYLISLCCQSQRSIILNFLRWEAGPASIPLLMRTNCASLLCILFLQIFFLQAWSFDLACTSIGLSAPWEYICLLLLHAHCWLSQHNQLYFCFKNSLIHRNFYLKQYNSNCWNLVWKYSLQRPS